MGAATALPPLTDCTWLSINYSLRPPTATPVRVGWWSWALRRK